MRLTSIYRIIGTKMIKLPKWNPIESFILAASLLSGIAGLLNASNSSQVIQKELDEWIVNTWYISIAVGSLITLYGLHFVKYFWATLGYFIVGPISIAYALTIMSTGIAPLAYSAIVILMFGIAGIVRGLQLFNLLKRIEKELE
jgi:hypothetical protein